MFDLNRAVHRYCRKLTRSWFVRSSKLVELEDHLHCEIEQRIAQGATPEEAFAQAVSQLGEAQLIENEFRKNQRGRLPVICKKCPQDTNDIAVTMFTASPMAVVGFVLVAGSVGTLIFQRISELHSVVDIAATCYAVSLKIFDFLG